MTFQASDFKGKHFLELLDNNNLPIKSVYTKNSMWFKSIGHSNSLCESNKSNHKSCSYRRIPLKILYFSCPCSHYPIESRCHILHECRRYNNNYWNPNRKSFNHFIMFLEFSPGAFSFHEGIT